MAAPAPRPMYGVSRIDQIEKKNHGWYVRVTLKGVTSQKFFADKVHGGKAKALKEAQAHRDDLVSKLPPARQEAAARARKVGKKKSAAAKPAAAAPAPARKAAPAKKAAKKAAKK